MLIMMIIIIIMMMMMMIRVAAWNSEDLPIYEPGLAEVVQEVSLIVLIMSYLQPS